jgi:hypothetical protein
MSKKKVQPTTPAKEAPASPKHSIPLAIRPAQTEEAVSAPGSAPAQPEGTIQPSSAGSSPALTPVKGDEKAPSSPPRKKFNEQDMADYARLRAEVRGSYRKMAEALREIRKRDLWKADTAKYTNFKSWCEAEGFTEAYVSIAVSWLEMTEGLEQYSRERGLENIEITKEDYRRLCALKGNFEAIRLAIDLRNQALTKAPKQSGVKVFEEKIEAVQEFVSLRASVPDLTWEEFEALENIGDPRTSDAGLPQKFLTGNDGNSTQRLCDHVRTTGERPANQMLLQFGLRGEGLIDLCAKIRKAYRTYQLRLEAQKSEADEKPEEPQAKVNDSHHSPAVTVASTSGKAVMQPGKPEVVVAAVQREPEWGEISMSVHARIGPDLLEAFKAGRVRIADQINLYEGEQQVGTLSECKASEIEEEQ